MLTHQIALVSKTRHIKTSDLTKVAAALQKQATRDLGPLWNIQATVDAFELLKDVPPGYWPIIVRDKIDDKYAYSVNGILLSDFYTPEYFDPVTSSAVRYSYTGAIHAPKQVLKNGYLSWLDPETGKWWQANYFGTKLVINDITERMDMLEGSLRARIDRITPTLRLTKGVSRQVVKINNAHAASQEKFGVRNANHWEQEINRLLKPRKVISAK